MHNDCSVVKVHAASMPSSACTYVPGTSQLSHCCHPLHPSVMRACQAAAADPAGFKGLSWAGTPQRAPVHCPLCADQAAALCLLLIARLTSYHALLLLLYAPPPTKQVKCPDTKKACPGNTAITLVTKFANPAKQFKAQQKAFIAGIANAASVSPQQVVITNIKYLYTMDEKEKEAITDAPPPEPEAEKPAVPAAAPGNGTGPVPGAALPGALPAMPPPAGNATKPDAKVAEEAGKKQEPGKGPEAGPKPAGNGTAPAAAPAGNGTAAAGPKPEEKKPEPPKPDAKGPEAGPKPAGPGTPPPAKPAGPVSVAALLHR